jgi:PIN domain nuclease of toxin-antitoxin system
MSIDCINLKQKNRISWHKLPRPLLLLDQFDRFLIWEAIRNDFVLIIIDENIKKKKKEGLKFLF